MIRISPNGQIPLFDFGPIDNRYSLPSISGAIQWNGNTKCFEVSTGSGWQKIEMDVSLNTTSEVTVILQWAKAKMIEDHELKILAESNPTILDLLNTIKDAQQKIKIVQTLIKAEVKV
jgi:hypothetical protein